MSGTPRTRSTWSRSAAGVTAPAVTHSRSDGTASSPSPTALTRWWYRVGTPTRTVCGSARSASIRSDAAKPGMIRVVAPSAVVPMTHSTWEKLWNIGSGHRMRSLLESWKAGA